MSSPISADQLSDPTRLGRLLSELENNPQSAEEMLAGLPRPGVRAHRIGFTGSPGVGKSSLVGRLIPELDSGRGRIAIIAVDPTSAISGGAVLGDRIRLSQPGMEGVFFRSMASRGSLGGVTPAASAVARVLEAAGYDRILIETVGVGQTGYDIASLADTVVALFSPEGGDGVQLLKAGIMEIGDIYAVNKCDRPGADLLAGEIRASLEMEDQSAGHHAVLAVSNTKESGNPAGAAGWEPPVLQVSARDGTGVDLLAVELKRHGEWIAGLPAGHPQRKRRIEREMMFVISTELGWMASNSAGSMIRDLSAEVLAGTRTMGNALQEIRRRISDSIRKNWAT